MPDASRADRHDFDFKLQGLGDASIPVPSSWQKPRTSPIAFPVDPELLERQRLVRKAKSDAVARFALADAIRHTEALKRTKREAYADGFDAGKDRGYNLGWWGGLMFGLMLGSALCFFAIKVGFAWGGQA